MVDTTGCGDCFVGMVLYEISKSLPIENLSEDEIVKIVRKANIAGALCATKKGAIPAIPEYSWVFRKALKSKNFIIKLLGVKE